jgi:very-short-patch-repair endonuclease
MLAGVEGRSRGGSRDETGARAEERHAREAAGRECDDTGADRAIVAPAARRHGIVTAAQLAAAGLSADAVRHRVRRGLLIRRHRGVYQVGPIAAPWAREMAAVLAAGRNAALSHHSAAAVWDLRPAHPGDVHVTVTGQSRHRPGLRIHRSHSLNAAVHHGLRLTTPARTLTDLAVELTERDLARAAEQAQILRLTDHATLIAQTGRGAARLRRALTTEPALTRSEAERRLLELVRAARLPAPEANVRVAGHEVDLLWRAQRVIVEVDGFAYHGTRAAFERDRRRDAALLAAGYRVIRLTWRQITEEPAAVAALLGGLLA